MLTELTVDKVDRVDRVDKVDKVDTVDKVGSADTVDRVDRVDCVGMVEVSLAKPGGGRASPRGEASRESALPTSLIACPSGGWPLNLLEVRIVGSVQYKRLAVYSGQKNFSLAFG